MKINKSQTLESLLNIVKTPVRLYKNNKYVNLNANVLVAAYPSIQAATCVSSAMSSSGYCNSAIATGSAVADWATYIPIHIGFHYLSKKQNFKYKNGKLNKKAFWNDVRKVYLTQIPSIALFYLMAGPLQYGLMKAGMEANTSILTSYWGTLIATRALHSYNYWRMENSKNK